MTRGYYVLEQGENYCKSGLSFGGCISARGLW